MGDPCNWKTGLKNQIKNHKKLIKQAPIDLKNLKKSKFQCMPKTYHYKKEKILQDKEDAVEKLKKCKEELKIGSKYIEYNLEQILEARKIKFRNIERENSGEDPLPLWTKKKENGKQECFSTCLSILPLPV